MRLKQCYQPTGLGAVKTRTNPICGEIARERRAAKKRFRYFTATLGGTPTSNTSCKDYIEHLYKKAPRDL